MGVASEAAWSATRLPIAPLTFEVTTRPALVECTDAPSARGASAYPATTGR